MKLLTNSILKRLPELYEQSKLPTSEVTLWVKFFTPWTSWAWYVSEYDPENGVFFGYVEGFENEWGYFSLEELSSIVGPLNMKIERDKDFTPTKFKDLKRLNNE
jgi:hypothetical protein